MKVGKIRGSFSDDAATTQLPAATLDESGLRRVPSDGVAGPEAFDELPTLVQDRPANDVRSALHDLADLLEPPQPPPVPRRARRAPPREASRVDLDAVMRATLPPPALMLDDAQERSRSPWLRRAAKGFACIAGALALAAAGWIAASAIDGAPRDRAESGDPEPEVAEPRAATAVEEPRAATAVEEPMAATAVEELMALQLNDVVIRLPSAPSTAIAATTAVPARHTRQSATALPAIPTREQVVRALRPLEADVRRCAEGHYGVASVRIAVHPTGRVTTATVTGGSVTGTPAGSCIARTLRRARFPRFTQPRFVVQYPFQL